MLQKIIYFSGVLLLLSIKLLAQTPDSILGKPEMIFVEGGTFEMGLLNGSDDNVPVHSVTIGPFSIGKYEVTVGQYKAFCSKNGYSMPDPPKWGWQDNHPMVNIDYDQANDYCLWLQEMTGLNWRLPTEAEWEYAARGGKKGKGKSFAGSNDLETVGWFADSAFGQTNIVGLKKPNELGIYDMSGNVGEWCHDWYNENYYQISPSSNPRGPSSGYFRVYLGGSWYDAPSFCHVTYRNGDSPSKHTMNLGFRVVLIQ
jgi:formylglycine-generating enzyme required for sulfatase activity